MKAKNQIGFILYLIFWSIGLILTLFLWYKDYYISSGIAFLVTIFIGYSFYHFTRKDLQKVELLTRALIKKDFSQQPQLSDEQSLYQQMIMLYHQLKKEEKNQQTYKTLYEGILNELNLGILILMQDEEKQWDIFYSNQEFAKILEIPKLKYWKNYQSKRPDFVQFIEDLDYQNTIKAIEIKVGEGTKKAFSLNAARYEFYGISYYVMALDAIQNIVDKKEKKAWYNLMKVISHELMNTLTPIQSLLGNVKDHFDENTTEQLEMKESLEVIQRKSEHLLNFVNAYRQLGQLPKPNKQRIEMGAFIKEIIQIMAPELEKEEVKINHEAQELFYISADWEMMERVFINLITNAIHSFGDEKERIIHIENRIINERNQIILRDNGSGVDAKIEDLIFLPFFTTREKGAGIGLPLAKSIIEAHGGLLEYEKQPKGTAFIIWMD